MYITLILEYILNDANSETICTQSIHSITDKRSIIHFILIIYLFNMYVSPLAFLNHFSN